MRPVIAYLDPGSGSIVLQAILGGAAGVALLWKTTRHRIRERFRRGGDTEQQVPVEDHSSDR